MLIYSRSLECLYVELFFVCNFNKMQIFGQSCLLFSTFIAQHKQKQYILFVLKFKFLVEYHIQHICDGYFYKLNIVQEKT